MKQGVVDKGTFKQITFRVPIKMNKPDIAAYFKQVYGLDVLGVHTVNYEGEKKRVPLGIYSRSLYLIF